MKWWRYWTRTSDPYNVSVGGNQSKISNDSMLCDYNSSWTGKCENSQEGNFEQNLLSLLDGVEAVIEAWPGMPIGIRDEILLLIKERSRIDKAV